MTQKTAELAAIAFAANRCGVGTSREEYLKEWAIFRQMILGPGVEAPSIFEDEIEPV